jgi:hypothetical protein
MKGYSKGIYCVETGETFTSISEAARKLKLHKALIQKVLKNKAKTTGGLTFKIMKKNVTIRNGSEKCTVPLEVGLSKI